MTGVSRSGGSEDSQAIALLRPRGTTSTLLLLIVVAGLICFAAWVSLGAPRNAGLAPIWPVTSLLLAITLRSPLRMWPGLLTAGLVGVWAAGAARGEPPTFGLLAGAVNALEAGAAAWGIRRFLGGRLDFTRLGEVLIFCLLVGVLVPAPAAAILALSNHVFDGGEALHRFAAWMTGDALGLLTLTPAFATLLSGTDSGLWTAGRRMRTVLSLASFGLVVGAVLTQIEAPVLYLAPPLLILLAFSLGVAGVALGQLMLAALALGAAVFGSGPFALMGPIAERVLAAQVLLAACTFTALPVAASLAERRRLEASLRAAGLAAEQARDSAIGAEQRLRLIVDSVMDYAIYMLDPDGRVSSWNAGAARISGYTSEEVLGRSAEIFMTEEDRQAQRLSSMLSIALATGKYDGKGWAVRKDGERVWVGVSIEPIRSEAGALVGYVQLAHDTSAERDALAALEDAKQKAEQASRAKSDFVANMSHELRTPLTAILGFSELLAGADLKEPERHYVGRVSDASQQLLTIVNDVLDFSKIEAGHLELAPEPVDLPAFVYEATALLSGQASLSALEIAVDIDDALPSHVLVDPVRLRQILLNLLGNAVKFTPRGGQIRLTAERQSASAIRFAVSDSGIGIPPEVQARLFQRFSQADTTTTRNFGGTGLGLAICAGLARLMGGEIGVESEVGVGSTFWFTIEAPEAVEAAKAAEPASPTLPDALVVLLVEDNSANRQLFRAVLEPLDIHVIEAVNGAEGLAAARRGGFDLILMDVQMPVMNGIEATRAIRALGGAYTHLPILGLTANVLPEQVREYLQAGMSDVLAKPVRAAELLQKIAFWLEGPEAAIMVDDTAGILAS